MKRIRDHLFEKHADANAELDAIRRAALAAQQRDQEHIHRRFRFSRTLPWLGLAATWAVLIWAESLIENRCPRPTGGPTSNEVWAMQRFNQYALLDENLESR